LPAFIVARASRPIALPVFHHSVRLKDIPAQEKENENNVLCVSRLMLARSLIQSLFVRRTWHYFRTECDWKGELGRIVLAGSESCAGFRPPGIGREP
jgi:hypothetical protein